MQRDVSTKKHTKNHKINLDNQLKPKLQAYKMRRSTKGKLNYPRPFKKRW